MSDEAKITDGNLTGDSLTPDSNSHTGAELGEVTSGGIDPNISVQEDTNHTPVGVVPNSQDIIPNTNTPRITLSSLGIDVTPVQSKKLSADETENDRNNSSPFKIEKDPDIVLTKDTLKNTENPAPTIEGTTQENTPILPINTGVLTDQKINTTVAEKAVKPTMSSSGNRLITMESLQSDNTPQEKPITQSVDIQENIQKKEDSEIFKNYESTFHSRKSTILMQLKKMRQIAKTNMVFIIFAIVLTFLGIYGLSYTDSRIHNYQNYKASVQGNYNIVANLVGLPTVVVDAPKLKDVIGVAPVGNVHTTKNPETKLAPITATKTATGSPVEQVSQKPKNTTKYNPYVIPTSTGEKAQITKEVLKDYFSN